MSKTSPKGQIDGVETVVDADAHVSLRFDDLLPYIDSDYEAAKRRLEESNSPTQQVFSATHVAPSLNDPYHDHTNTHDIKLEQHEEFGIDYGFLVPSLMNSIGTCNNPRFAVALANAYNSYLAENFLDAHDSYKAAIVVAPQKPDAAAEEIDDRAAEDDFAGVNLPPGALLPPLGDEKYDPICQAAVDNDLPLIVHGTNSAFQSTLPTQYYHSETYFESHFLSHPIPLIWNLATSIIRGVPERFPGIEFVFQEAGVGYIPFAKWRLDDIYYEQSEEVPWMDKLPSEYINDNFYFTTQPLGETSEDASHTAQAIEMAGPGNIMYSSDLPHPTFDPPRELYNRITGHLDDEAVADIMGGTAADVFGF